MCVSAKMFFVMSFGPKGSANFWPWRQLIAVSLHVSADAEGLRVDSSRPEIAAAAAFVRFEGVVGLNMVLSVSGLSAGVIPEPYKARRMPPSRIVRCNKWPTYGN